MMMYVRSIYSICNVQVQAEVLYDIVRLEPVVVNLRYVILLKWLNQMMWYV